MVSAQQSNLLRTELGVRLFDCDPDATTATDVHWLDMRDFHRLLVGFFRTVGTSNVTFRLLANSKADGSGTEVVVKEYSGDQPNAVGDQVFLELQAEEIAPLGKDLRYVSASVTFATATDEAVIAYIGGVPRQARDSLTPDRVA